MQLIYQFTICSAGATTFAAAATGADQAEWVPLMMVRYIYHKVAVGGM